MTPVACGKKLKSNFNSVVRSYSACRALIGNAVNYKHDRFLLAGNSINYQQLLRLSKGGSGQKRRNYYDVLQLTPKATQSQVKNAYYNLSKTYHPDQYKGAEDASLKFREITEAYEVLGNFHKRKMYDRGIFTISTAATPAEAEEYSAKFYESRRKKGYAPTSTGRTPIFNFDEWSKAHYDHSRVRREDAKIRYEKQLKKRLEQAEGKKTDIVVTLFIFGVIFMILYSSTQQDLDTGKHKGK
ncbi:dnaJ homolog subfamily C member 30, mitochondrial [Procambarus clarkii]|uniref:dnaJ homolog subfamily C member 30, mitochondrial n=1 Tax=Procambarus clarkii TaxID=6728 RepID=UPI0037420924